MKNGAFYAQYLGLEADPYFLRGNIYTNIQ